MFKTHNQNNVYTYLKKDDAIATNVASACNANIYIDVTSTIIFRHSYLTHG